MFGNLTGRGSLPSLNALRAFEAMARCGGATRAAVELNVTHSAISRQVKALEAALGARLFEGPRHDLKLTAEGRMLMQGLGVGFDAITEAVRAVRGRDEVYLAIHSSLAVKWLIPRLSRFEADCPGVTLHLSDLAPEAMSQRGADLAVRIVDGEALTAPGLTTLAPSKIGPVCAPGLASGWTGATRLEARTHMRGWSDWTALTGKTAPTGPARPLAHLHFVLDAAVAGLGVGVLPERIAADAILEGRLIAPEGFAADGAILAALSADAAPSQAVRKLTRWLQVQAKA